MMTQQWLVPPQLKMHSEAWLYQQEAGSLKVLEAVEIPNKKNEVSEQCSTINTFLFYMQTRYVCYKVFQTFNSLTTNA